MLLMDEYIIRESFLKKAHFQHYYYLLVAFVSNAPATRH